MSRRFGILSVILISHVLVLCSEPERKPFPPPRHEIGGAEPTFDDYVGSGVCRECHREEYDLWKDSTHGRAGGPANSETVIGRFDGRVLRFKDARVTPFIGKNDAYLFAVEPSGFSRKLLRADLVVGGGHMEGGGTQTYFSQFADGTIRFLPFDFIRKESLWFGETKHARGWIPINEELSIADLSEWPPSRILGAEPHFNNCQECHGSQIQTRYDVEKKRYVTQFKSLSINCESCHGPGKRHVELARSGKMFDLQDIGLKALSTLSKDESLEVCFRCHALKDVLEPGYLPGKDLNLYYALRFPMLGENPYHPDGRVRAFGYQQNHLYSDCYLNGSMTCVDCHEPHSQFYRDVNGLALAGRFDNGQCTGCHASKAQVAEGHAHHKPDSPGSLCTSCHMPYLQHKAMGPRLRFARSDHTIPIPRPEFDAKLGIKNACKKCHQDRSIAWLQAKTEAWYGRIKPHKQIVTNLMQAQRGTNRRDAASLLFADSTSHAMAQVAGLSFFIRKFLTPNLPELEPEIIGELKNLSHAQDLDLRALALAALHFSLDQSPDVHDYLVTRLSALGSEEMAIRKRWSVALAYLAKGYREKGELADAILVYNKALEIKPNDVDVLVNLGIAYRDKQVFDRAIGCFRQALAMRAQDSMIWVNLGLVYQRLGDAGAAMTAYKKGVDSNPWNAKAHFNLGNHFYRSNDLQPAIASYHKAIEIDPGLAQGYFNLARAYIKTRDLQKALASVRAGLLFDPDNRTARQMLKDLEAFFSNR